MLTSPSDLSLHKSFSPIKALLKFARQSRHCADTVGEDGAIHLKMLEAMKKEFRLLRILWRQIYDHVAAVDELNMSTMRLRLRYEEEPAVSQVLKLCDLDLRVIKL